MTIYLYVKTHTKTGLKYLGKTTRNPYTYLGSGISWRAHLKEHGIEHSTKIIKECESNEELNKWGRYFSNLWNIVESDAWANRIPETGGGYCDEKAAAKISLALKGRKKPPRTKEHMINLAASHRGKPKIKTSIGLKKWYSNNPDRSKTIQKQAKSLKKFHKNNPQVARTSAFKIWAKRYEKDYEKYKIAITYISENKTIVEITKLMSIDYATVKKLKLGTHRVFQLFPELIQLKRSKVF